MSNNLISSSIYPATIIPLQVTVADILLNDNIGTSIKINKIKGIKHFVAYL